MELTTARPRRARRPVRFSDPSPFGYIHLAAAVAPPRRPGPPVPGPSPARAALLDRCTALARDLEDLDTVTSATVYRATVIPPVTSGASPATHAALHPARYDVAVLIETPTPAAIGEVQDTAAYRSLLGAIEAAARDRHVMTARCHRQIADVDRTRQGLFLFNYLAADPARAELAVAVWEHLAAWYAANTGLTNSTLLAPLGEADYALVNHARWDTSVARFMARQFTRPSFWTDIVATLRANHLTAMPILYRLA
ncbi:MAG TPA: hypothetical protein VE152_04730 [Acidimicrobiales bacterium]|jgi:hypothetical protein|nr:hypothetical protein [Acidimicrobiales bacterium]